MAKLYEPHEYYKNLSLENIEGEIWADIEGFEGYYQISDMGRVKSLDRFVPNARHGEIKITQRIMKMNFCTSGYLKATFRKNRIYTQRMAHRLVGIHFIENPENKPQINHKKGIKTDNRKTELEWSTMGENNLHAYRTGLKKHHACWKGKTGYAHNKSKEVIQFTLEMVEVQRFGSATEAAKQLGLSNNIGYFISKGKPNNGMYFQYSKNDA